MIKSINFGGPATSAPTQHRMKLAQALMAQGADTSPVGHWTQGLARVAQAASGAHMEKKLRDEQTAKQDAYNETLRTALDPANVPEGVDRAQYISQALMGNDATAGMGAQLELARAMQKPEKTPRDIVTGADGYKYYKDDGSRVLPDVVKPDPHLLSPEALAQRLQTQKAGATSVNNILDGGFKVPNGYMRDPENPSGAIVPIPGGPAARKTPESAAKTQLLEDGIHDLDEAVKLLFEEGDVEKGKIDRLNLVNSKLSVPFSEGREIEGLVLNAIEAKLRAESGAAVPETEVARKAKTFIPQPGDSDSQVRGKIRRMKAFMEGAIEKTDPQLAKRLGIGNSDLTAEELAELEQLRKEVNGGSTQ